MKYMLKNSNFTDTFSNAESTLKILVLDIYDVPLHWKALVFKTNHINIKLRTSMINDTISPDIFNRCSA